eukprot:SM000076S21839  [mRNA]  locus=s76:434121:442111:- [translate_table: standard]
MQQMSLGPAGGPGLPPPATGPPPPSWGAPPPGTAVGTAQRRVYPEAYAAQRQGGPAPGQGMPPPPLPGMPNVPSPHSPSGGGGNRIDPTQMPRPTASDSVLVFETRVAGAANLPPPATTSFVVRDTGNCSPRIMRCTLNQLPGSADLHATSSMPLALLVQPLALQDPNEDPVPVVDFGESGPVRCQRCKTYINPFMRFIDQGHRFICNLCSHSNETPRDYMCNLGPDGRRRDADERPELSRGSVEFVAPTEFIVRPPMPPVYFFLVDVSANAVQEGDRTHVAFATFDSTIHFYNLNPSLQQPSMLVVPDIQDPYTPLPSDVVVPLLKCRANLEQLVENVPNMFQAARVADSAFGAAVKAAYLAMKSTGGKLLVFQSALPSVGFGSLIGREAEGRTGSVINEKEAHKMLSPADKTFKTLAFELAEFQVSVDLFLMTQSFVDIASQAVVPRTTGGQVYYYFPFNAGVDSAKVFNDLRWNVCRPQGFEAIMRGLQVVDYFGSFCKRIPTDIDLPAVDCDKAVMVTFKHDDKFQEGTEACFQAGQKFGFLAMTTVLGHLFRGADLDAQFSYFLKQAALDVVTTGLPQVKDSVVQHCTNILATYRKFCASASSSGQLILPEALKLLPLYSLALTKSIGLRNETRLDERSYWLSKVASISAPLAVPLVYPCMYPVHKLPHAQEGVSVLPPVVSLSSEHLDHEGIFLLENGEDAYLWTGKAVPADLLKQLIGYSSVDEVASSQFLLREFDNPASKRLNELVNEIRRHRCSYLRLYLVKKGDASEARFFSFLTEDRGATGMSYVEFLVNLHRQIQNKMT